MSSEGGIFGDRHYSVKLRSANSGLEVYVMSIYLSIYDIVVIIEAKVNPC